MDTDFDIQKKQKQKWKNTPPRSWIKVADNNWIKKLESSSLAGFKI